MSTQSRSTQPGRSWLFTVLACLALTAQIMVAFAPLAEARQGRSMDAHVESGTTQGHYAHDDARCASCQARSIHSPAAKAPADYIANARAESIVVTNVDRIHSADLSAQTNPRAPPSVT